MSTLHPFIERFLAPMEIPFLLETVDEPGSHILDSDDFTIYKKLLRLSPDGSKLKVECELRADYHDGARYYGLVKDAVLGVPIDSVIFLTDKEQEELGCCGEFEEWRRECWEGDQDSRAAGRDWDRDR